MNRRVFLGTLSGGLLAPLAAGAQSDRADRFVADPPAFGSSDTTPPTCTITAPTAGTTYATVLGELTTLAGTASDNVAVTSVTWANDRGGSGTATGTTSWSIPSIALSNGANVITVSAHDAGGNGGTDTITVTSTPRFSVSSRTEMAATAAISPTLGVWPDTGQGILNNGNGTYTFIAGSGGGGTIGFGQAVGTFTNPLATSAGGIVAISGLQDAPDAGAADITYHAGGPVYVDPGSGLWLCIVHYETLVKPGSVFSTRQYFSWLGIAKSSNGGATWTDCGAIITSFHSRAEMEALWAGFGRADGDWYNAEAGWGPYLIVDGYLYVYYFFFDGEIQPGGLTYQDGMGVARALLADVVTAAASNTVPVFHKYNAGTWTELGIRGQGKKVIPRFAAMSYNTFRDRYIALRVDDFSGHGHMEFGYFESTDGVTWSASPEVVTSTVARPPTYWYWTLIDPASPVPYQTGAEFYLTAWSIENHDYSRWTVTLDVTTPAHFDIGIR